MPAEPPQLFKLPKLYENMDEATVGKWLRQEGDAIDEGQPLVELITDKTVVEYESPYAGVLLKTYATEKSVVPIGYALAAIGAAGQAAPDVAEYNRQLLAASSEELTTAAPPAPAAPAPSSGRLRIAPAARAFAKKHQIDLDVVAQELGGRVIHRRDLEAFLGRK